MSNAPNYKKQLIAPHIPPINIGEQDLKFISKRNLA